VMLQLCVVPPLGIFGQCRGGSKALFPMMAPSTAAAAVIGGGFLIRTAPPDWTIPIPIAPSGLGL
jgi:hypothetical protein